MSTETLAAPPDASAKESRPVLLQVAAIPEDAKDLPRASAPTQAAPLKKPLAAGSTSSKTRQPFTALRAGFRGIGWTLSCCTHLIPRRLRPSRPAPRKLWVIMVAVTCISGGGLIFSHVKSKQGAQDLAENEIADDFKDIKIEAAPLNAAGPETQPLAAPAQPQLGGRWIRLQF